MHTLTEPNSEISLIQVARDSCNYNKYDISTHSGSHVLFQALYIYYLSKSS